MMYLTYSKRRRPRRPGRSAGDMLQDAGWTGLSVAAALILLPAIGLKAVARAMRPPKVNRAENDRTRYLIQ